MIKFKVNLKFRSFNAEGEKAHQFSDNSLFSGPQSLIFLFISKFE